MRAFFVSAAFLMLGAGAYAAETTTYTYDARGRLKQVSRSGGVNGSVTSTYTLDKAENRLSKVVAATPPPPPTFSVNNASATEGGTVTFTVTKTGAASSSFSVNYATSNGTGTSGSDYTAASGTLTFASTDASKTVSVSTLQDALVEAAETFNLNLSGATGGATISDALGVGTINDDDVPATCSGVSFSISDASAVEVDPLVFTVTKTGSTSISCSVNYATADGTAVAPGDYVAKSGTLTFTSAQTTLTVSVTTNSNALVAEPDETMKLNLSAPTGGATITDSQGIGTIFDDGASGGGGCPDPRSC